LTGVGAQVIDKGFAFPADIKGDVWDLIYVFVDSDVSSR
jgi:hypothetical protein